MITSTEEERRYQVRVGFERDKKELQFRRRDDPKWHDATWTRWEWDEYDYRLKPENPVFEEIAIYPVLCPNKSVAWVTKDSMKHLLNYGYRKITRFVTRDKVRHAVIEAK